jgi:hypothetical protein
MATVGGVENPYDPYPCKRKVLVICEQWEEGVEIGDHENRRLALSGVFACKEKILAPAAICHVQIIEEGLRSENLPQGDDDFTCS